MDLAAPSHHKLKHHGMLKHELTHCTSGGYTEDEQTWN